MIHHPTIPPGTYAAPDSAARTLGIDPALVRDWLARGLVRAERQGRSVLVDLADVQRLARETALPPGVHHISDVLDELPLFGAIRERRRESESHR